MQCLVLTALSCLPLLFLQLELLTYDPGTCSHPPFLIFGIPSYQGEEQEVQLYYKVFSSTRHGFLGAGVVSQPLSHVWAAVSDPTLWPLYHKPIQTVRLHQRVTNSINLGKSRETSVGCSHGKGGRLEAALLGGRVLRLPQDSSGEVQLGVSLWHDGTLRPLGGEGFRTTSDSPHPCPSSVLGVQSRHVCTEAASGFLLCLRGSQRGACLACGKTIVERTWAGML